MVAIETQNIVKKYGELTAVSNVDIKVETGECFGLLGPNGAGKTTLVKMITAVAPIKGGRAWVAGMEVALEPRKINAVKGLLLN